MRRYAVDDQGSQGGRYVCTIVSRVGLSEMDANHAGDGSDTPPLWHLALLTCFARSF